MKHAEPAAGLLECEQLRIADPEQRSTQDRHQRHGILRIGKRAQQPGERLDLGRLAKGTRAADLDRDVQQLQGLCVRHNPSLFLSGQDQKVAVAPVVRIDFGADVPGDPFSILAQHLVPLAGVGQRPHAAGSGVAFAGIECRETRRPGLRPGRKPRREDLIRPLAQWPHRSEIQRERHDPADRRIAEALPDDIVDIDVGAPETVDRLLRIADDEQRPWPERHRAPADVLGSYRRCCGILGQPEHDFRLDGIGVLKLVNEDVTKLLLQRPANRQVSAQHACGQIKQIAVVQRVQAAALGLGTRARPCQQRDGEPIDVLPPLREIRRDGRSLEIGMERGNDRPDSLLLPLRRRPIRHRDFRVDVPGIEQRRDHRRAIEPAARHVPLSLEIADRLQNGTAGAGIDLRRQQLLQLRPERLERATCRRRIRRRPVTGRKVDIVVETHRRERLVEVGGTDASVQERHHVRVAGGTSAGHELAPDALPQFEILRLVELGKPRRDARFHRPLPQQARTERVDRPGEKALQVRERRHEPRDPLGSRRVIRPRFVARFGQLAFEREMKPAAQLGGRLAGKRHGRQVLDQVHAGRHAGRHPLGQHLGLAGARPGFDEDVRQQLLADQPARFPINDARLRHRPQAFRMLRAWNPDPSGLPARSRVLRTPRRTRNTCSRLRPASERTVL